MGFGRTRNRRRADAERREQSAHALLRALGSCLLGLAVCAALGGGAFLSYRWALSSPTFAVKRLSVSGNERAVGAELLKLAGLQVGQNLLALDVDAAERAIAAHPWVARARIDRRWPDGLSVQVVERVPAAIVSLGDLYLLDDDGEPFKKLQALDRVDLPVVTGVERDEYVRAPKETSRRIAAALKVAREYSESAKGGKALSEVRLEGNGVALVTGDGVEIRLGEGEVRPKLERLAAVRAELARRGLVAEVIHLDNRARPAWVTVKVSAPVSERREPK